MADSNGHSTSDFPSWLAPILRTFQSMSSRLGLSHRLGSTHDGMRSMEAVLGYKDRVEYRDFKRAYSRNDLAQRIVTTWPDATWSQPPQVRDDPTAPEPTPFEDAWTGLEQRLAIYRQLSRVDVLAQLGHYGVLLIGLRGQEVLWQPARPVRSPDDVLFLQPYSEELLMIETFDTDASSPTYGKPATYRLVSGATDETSDTSLRRPIRSGIIVHASRVLHLAGQRGLDDPEIYGLPILEAVYNKLVDVLKVVGGGAEMFWRNWRRIALEVQDGYHLSAEDREALDLEAAEYEHGMRNFLRLMGVQAKDLSGPITGPKEHFDVLMQTIAGTTRIPLRILLGSERGELASSQDDATFKGEVVQRQTNYAEPMGLRPFVDKLVGLVTTLEPRDRVTILWPNLWALSEKEQAEVMKNRAQGAQAALTAAATYTGPGLVSLLLSPAEVRGLLAPVWQVSEMELPVEVPPEVEEAQRLALEMPPGDDSAVEAQAEGSSASPSADDSEEDTA